MTRLRRRWRRLGRARTGWRRGVAVEVFKVFSLDKVLQRSAEQVIGDDYGCGQGSTALRGAGPRGAPRRCLTRVWLRRSPTYVSHLKPGHYFHELLFWQTLALVFATVNGDCWKNFLRFSTFFRASPGSPEVERHFFRSPRW